MKVLNSGISTGSNTQLFEFTQGLDVDSRLYYGEIDVQKAWAHALADAGYLTEDEAQRLSATLDEAEELMSTGQFKWVMEDEDIHMNLERFMTEKLGELGKKIHIGRSRNDLIATTLRLSLCGELDIAAYFLRNLILAIRDVSHKWIDIISPGMTHMQFGQPIRFGHLFSAHGHALKRDLRRLEQAQDEALEYMPLGSAAFAGTHVSIDFEKLAEELSFSSTAQHSYDAVSDRDYILSALAAYGTLAMHLSRLCEDVMYWSSSGIKVLKLPYDWSTGSSIMPNKRNPDVPELVRAKMARVMTAMNEGLTLMRSVTPSYGSDIHELKRTFFNAQDELMKSLNVLTPFIAGLEVDTQNLEALLNKGHILATDIANEITKNTTFRDAYKQTAEAIKNADAEGLQIHEYYKKQNQFTDITFESSVEKRHYPGGTSKRTALAAIEALSVEQPEDI